MAERSLGSHTGVAWWLVAPCIVTWTNASQFDRRRGWATEARKVSCCPKGGEGEVGGAGGSGCNGPVALRDARCTSSFGAAALLECAASGDRTACASACTSAGFVLGAGGAALRARRAFQFGWPFNVGGERQESEAVGAKAQVAWKSRRKVRQANRRSRPRRLRLTRQQYIGLVARRMAAFRR